jgi:alpha-tubulin suppressor-like RCC1 family protein
LRIQGIGSNAAVLGNASTSIAVDLGTGVIPTAISVGNRHTCAITSGPGNTKGSLYCWGSNVRGQLGTPPGQVLEFIECSCDITLYALL